jgi:hypothetical protein
MSFYVKREHGGRISWTGPIRSARQAEREAEAWRNATDGLPTGWTTTVEPSTPEVRKQVRDWERDKKANA